MTFAGIAQVGTSGNSTVSFPPMSAALTQKEARIIAHAYHKFKDQDRKKYKLMNEYCMHHGLCQRSSDQLKYLVESKSVTKEAVAAKDTWDSDVENKVNQERIAAGGSTGSQSVKVEKEASSMVGEDSNVLAHRKRCRELLTEQNLYLKSIAESLKL